MNFRKVLMVLLSAAVLSSSTVTIFAADSKEVQTINEVKPINVSISSKDEDTAEKQAYFNSFTGTVKTITDSERAKGSKYVLVEKENGQTANIIISKDTYILNNAEVTEGQIITGFYAANAPMIMIYPPQYNAEVVVVGSMDQNVKVDVFDKNLVSADKSLKLNISDKTEVILQDGKAYKGELANRKLVVIYGTSTRSIPAQINPAKVIVLFEKASEPAINPTEQGKDVQTGDVPAIVISGNNEKIEIPVKLLLKKLQLWLQALQLLNQ